MRTAAAGAERGAATVETFGVVTVVALVVVAAILAFTVFDLGPKVSEQLCRIVAAAQGASGASCGAGGGGTTADDGDYQPPACMYYEKSETAGSTITIGFIKIGDENGFIVSKTSDGKIALTAVDASSVGAEGGFGGGFDLGRTASETQAGWEVKLGADLKVSYGDTWVFEDEDEYKKMRQQLEDYLGQKAVDDSVMMTGGNPGGLILAQELTGTRVDPPKDPEQHVSTMELELGIDAGIGLREPTSTGSGTGQGNGHGTGSQDEPFDPNVGLTLSGEGSGQVVVTTNDADKTKAYTYVLSGGATGEGSLVAGSASAGWKGEGSFTVKRDENGEVVEISFKTAGGYTVEGELGNDSFETVSGGADKGEGSSTVTETTLTVDDSNRAVVDQWLSQRPDALNIPLSAVIPEKPSDDPFEQLMYEQAKVSQVEYKNIQDGFAFDASIKVGLTLGFGMSMEESTAQAVDAHFLGAPDVNGVRGWTPDALCMAAAGS